MHRGNAGCRRSRSLRISHGAIGDWPAWYVAPYVSLWAVESLAKPGSVGWWVIAGDLPTDCVSAGAIKHPREALRAFAEEWRRYCEALRSGSVLEEIEIGIVAESAAELVPLLEARAGIVAGWANDDAMWEDG